MTRFIVHPGTLTVIDAAECLIIDIDTDLSDEERADLDGDDYFDDSLICEYAEQRGRPVAAAETAQTNVCPVSEISGHVHSYDNDTHYFVPWSVMGDTRTTVRVCQQCAEHSELQQCDNCGTPTSVDNAGLCDTCFSALPNDEWHTAGTW